MRTTSDGFEPEEQKIQFIGVEWVQTGTTEL